MEIAWNEHTIQEMIVQRNDEQAACLIDALLELVPDQIEERISKLMQFGRRYMVLALLKENGTASEDIEALLVRRFEQRRTHQLASDGQRDNVAFHWYAKAGRLFSAVLEQAQSSQSKSTAATHRGLVYAVCGAYDLALADLNLARYFVPLSPNLSYWREMIFALQGTQETACAALNSAHEQNKWCHQTHPRIMVNAMSNSRSARVSHVL